jgi:hypothetical protein
MCCKQSVFAHSNSFLSTAIYTDAILWYYNNLFLKMPKRCKYFGVFRYTILIYVGLYCVVLCSAKYVFAQPVTFRHYCTAKNTKYLLLLLLQRARELIPNFPKSTNCIGSGQRCIATRSKLWSTLNPTTRNYS